MRLRPFAFTCLLTLSVKQCGGAFETSTDIAQAATDMTKASKATAPVNPSAVIEHRWKPGEEVPLEAKDHAAFSELRSPSSTSTSEHPGATTGAIERFSPDSGHPPHPGRPPHDPDPARPNPYDELENAPSSAQSSVDAWMKDATQFRFPRYPPEDEWRIKTWTIEKWRAIQPKLSSGISTIFGILAWPFQFLKAEERKFGKIPLYGLRKPPTAAWEILPSGIKEAKGTRIRAWLAGLKDRMLLKSPRVSEEEEDPLPFLKKPIENSRLEVPPESKWRIPKFAPVTVKNTDLIQQSYLLGSDAKTAEKMKMVIDARKSTEAISAKDQEALNALLTSSEHLELIEALHKKRNSLALVHEKMQGVLNQVVHDLDGEKNTREAFRQILQYYGDHISNPVSQHSKTAKRVGVTAEASLRLKYPKADKIHLSPLLLLEDVTNAAGINAASAVKDASGYIGDVPRLDRLLDQASKVQEHAQLIRQVDQLHDKFERVSSFVSSLTQADFADWGKKREVFLQIVSLTDVN